MTPHILVGVDFSPGAFAALLEARELAHLMGLELRVMHVQERGPLMRDPGFIRHWLGAAGLDADGLQVRVGQPWVELAREAAESGSGVLVVGSHGGSGPQPVGLGSTATRLGLIAPCPVVVVGPRVPGPAQTRTRRHRADASCSTPHGD